MFLPVLLLFVSNTLTHQDPIKSCEESVCIPLSECSEVQGMLVSDDMLNQAKSLYCGYSHEPFVCCKRDCRTPNENYGIITSLDDCVSLKQNTSVLSRQKWNFLRESRVNETHVCCNEDENDYIVIQPAPIVQVPKRPCITPNGEVGKCVEIEECGTYLELLGEVDEKFRYINDSYCGWWSKAMVCCGSVNYYKETYAGSLPSGFDCGMWSSDDPQQRIPPWLALITQKGSKDGCVGALINEQYVISTTNCNGNLTNTDIRFGECINNQTLINCVYKPLKIAIFPLHKYHKSEDTGVVLIKLNRAVQSPQGPICLPDYLLPLSIDIDILGLHQEGETWSSHQETSLTIENQLCEDEFKDYYINRIVCLEHNICKSDRINLMHYLVVQHNANKWFLEGLLNRERCYGYDNKLFHAVSVYKFIPWIRSNLT